MSTHVIVLCQGSQSRLPNLPVAKQFLPMPACGGTPILYRTLRQLWHAMDLASGAEVRVTVVGWLPLAEHLHRYPVVVPFLAIPQTGEMAEFRFFPSVDTLPDPGNSSLKGISRYLELERSRRLKRWSAGPVAVPVEPPYDQTIVLLGDVVYSWDCLRTIVAPHEDVRETPVGWKDTQIRFVGTREISQGGGELWGISWGAKSEHIMMSALEQALDNHPPAKDVYQCGQLRRWMWALHPMFQTTSRYVPIMDYTDDIDLPADVTALPELSEAAALDDAQNGVTW